MSWRESRDGCSHGRCWPALGCCGHIAAAPPAPHPSLEALDFVLAGVTVLGALLIAAWALREPMSERFARIVADRATALMVGMRRLHSGCVNDYVAWLVAGLAVIGGALALV